MFMVISRIMEPNAAGDLAFTFTGDATGDNNLTLNLKAGDKLNIAVASGSNNLWIVSTATTGLGPTYSDNINPRYY